MLQQSKIGQSALTIAPLAFGGNVFGWTADKVTSFALLDGFVAGGGDFIDTADGYSRWVPGNSGGESEHLIGEWITARGNRDQVVVATKVFSHPEFPGLSAANIAAAADASLQRLHTDRIDLYYAHHDDESVPLEETVAAFSQLVDTGKIRAIALSNYSAERIEQWLQIARAGGFHLPVALQPHYNLMERSIETNGVQALAVRESLSLFPYYALASGFLTGKYRDSSDTVSKANTTGATGVAEQQRLAESLSPRAGGAKGYLNDTGRAVLAALDTVAAQHGITQAAVALAWLRQQPAVTAPIASASRVEQLPALLESLRTVLSAEDLAALNSASTARTGS